MLLGLQVFVEMLNGNRFSLYMDKRDTVWKMKLEIEKVKGLPPHTQRLIFAGKPLDDEKALDYYAIEDKSTVYLDSWIKAVQDTCTENKRIDVKLHLTETTCMQQRAEEKLHVTETACVQQNVEAKLHVTETACEQQHANVVARELERVEEERHIAMQENQRLREALQSGHEARQEIEAALERRTLIMRDDLHTEREETRRLQERVREENERANRAEQGSRQLEGRVREMEGRVKEENERANRAEREANRRVTDVEQAAQHDRERAQLLQQQLHDAGARVSAADFWVVQSDDVHLTDEEIGRGGWAVVKVAHFRGLRVAAKCLHADLVYPYHRNIFQREISIAAKLRHPNLLQFIGATVEPVMIILTELMPTSLRALVNRTRLTNKQIVSIALDVARALNYLHLMRPHPILHRDLSSANVLLEPTPEDGWRAKVSDYGAANFSQYLRTENPGSPVYSAPEARNPDLQSAKMDIYSFGVLLIEMCTSEFPFPEMRPRLIPTIAHAQLVALIRSCLAPDRHQRPRCSVVIERLDAIEL